MSSNLRVAFVLAAGRGERLRPYTDKTPKPLMPISGRPILYHTLKALEPLRLERVVLNAWHLKEQILDFARRHQKDFGFEVLVSPEDDLLGTGGGLKQALSLIDLKSSADSLLMMNGDVLFRGDLFGFCQRAMASQADGYWWLAPQQPNQTVIRYGPRGVVAIGDLWSAKGFSVSSSDYASGCFSGVQIFRRMYADRLPMKGCIIRDYWIPLLKEDKVLAGDSQGLDSWADIGTPQSYLALKDSLPQS